jgi:hypothetical protein
MLKFSDSRNFSRTLAGLGLIAGPALFLVSQILSPAWSDDTAEYLEEVAGDEGLHLLSALLFLLGGMLLLAGALGVIKLMRRGRRVSLGQVAGFLVALGTVATTAFYVLSVIDISMVDEAADRAEMVALSERAEDSGGAAIFFIPYFFLGFVLGFILLGIAMIRSRVVPVWAGIAVLASIVVAFVGGDSQAASVVGGVLLLAGLTPLGLRILSLSDDHWERWQVIDDERGRDAAATPAPATPAA